MRTIAGQTGPAVRIKLTHYELSVTTVPVKQDEEQRRRATRFDLWLFGSVWLVVLIVAAIAVLLEPQ